MRVDLVIPGNNNYDEDIFHNYNSGGAFSCFLSFHAEDTNGYYKKGYNHCSKAACRHEPCRFGGAYPRDLW